MAGLRDIERKVIAGLERDARAHFSKIGKKMRKSQQQVSYTVNSLEKQGIIKGYYTIIDYSKLDVLHFRAYFKVSYISEKKMEELARSMASEPMTCFVATCGGEYDLIATFLAKNPSQFNKALHKIMEKHPRHLQNFTVLTTVVARGSGRKYLFSNTNTLTEDIYGGDREAEKIDELDMRLLERLSANARESALKLAAKLGTTSKTVIERIKRMQDRLVIRSFRPLLDLQSAGYKRSLLTIRYHNITAEKENELINFLNAHPNVLRLFKTIGEWDVEVELEGEDAQKLRKIEMEIRERFAALIQTIRIIPLYDVHKINYFPKILEQH
ncbi:Lrp/AsnC family transcriptional regulator [Candidatus Woesearchaeota archaeon]|nr:Lrp/AsnC family transcriptional regulator [Candidatus Woesearchaeota archaeon]